MCHKLKAVFLFNGLGVVAKSNLNAALSYKRTAKNLGNTVSCCSLNLCFYNTHSYQNVYVELGCMWWWKENNPWKKQGYSKVLLICRWYRIENISLWHDTSLWQIVYGLAFEWFRISFRMKSRRFRRANKRCFVRCLAFLKEDASSI